jgi:hypothetical protein
MNANPAGFSSKHSTPARQQPVERPPTLADLVERWVRCSYESDVIFRGAERAFPPADLSPAGRRGYREAIARLIVRHRHGVGPRQAGGEVVAP